MRSDEWLVERFNSLWSGWFSDVERLNEVVVKFKGHWKNKFGHIKMTNGVTEIAVNGLFRNLKVPEDIVDITLAHEICHYAHGFHSPHPKKYKYPHQGGVVNKELKSRGFNVRKDKEFVKNWYELYGSLTGKKVKVNRSPKIIIRHFR